MLLFLRRYASLRPAIRPAQRLWLWLRLTSKYLRDIIVHFIDDGGSVLAGYIAFSGLLALFPFLIVLTITASYLGQGAAASQAVQEMVAVLPPEVGAVLRPAVDEVLAQPPTGLLGISVLGAIWAASSGLEALREAPTAPTASRLRIPIGGIGCRACGWSCFWPSSRRSPWWRSSPAPDLDRGHHLRRTALARAAHLHSVALPAWLSSSARRDLGALSDPAQCLLAQARNLSGAAFTVLAWLATASLFSLYLSYATNFSVTYGSLGGIVVTLIFFYVSAAIFVLGAEINAVRRRRRRRRERASGASG